MKDGTVVPETFEVALPTSGILSYGNRTYYYRIKVFDQDLEESEWSDTASFVTSDHAGPEIRRDISPAVPLMGRPVTLSDTSVCYDGAGNPYDCRSYVPPVGNVSYLWDFGDGTPNSDEVNPEHTYQDADTYTVIQRVTDDSGLMCQDTFGLEIGARWPTWIEIPPE